MSSNPVKIVGSESASGTAKVSAPAEAVYANATRIFATPNEFVFDFAMNLNAFGQMVEEDPKIVSRVIMSYDGAKRLAAHLVQTLQACEQKYGPIELDISKRLQKTAS